MEKVVLDTRSQGREKWVSMGKDKNSEEVYSFLTELVDTDETIIELRSKQEIYSNAMEAIKEKETKSLADILETHKDPNVDYFSFTFPVIPIPNQKRKAEESMQSDKPSKKPSLC